MFRATLQVQAHGWRVDLGLPRSLPRTGAKDMKALMAGNDGKYDIALDPLWNGEADSDFSWIRKIEE
jgi:hypothetical protein